MRPLSIRAASLLGWCAVRTVAVLPTAMMDVFDPVSGRTYSLLASQASFGFYPLMTPANNPVRTVVLPPPGDGLLCNEAEGIADYSPPSQQQQQQSFGVQGVGESDAVVAEAGLNEPGTVMLVPRGSCTFERKALSAQRLGASAIAIHGSLQSRYILNTTEPLGPNATDAERKRERTDEAEGRKCWGRECTIDDVLWPGDRYDYDCSYGRAMVPTSVLSFNPLPYNGYENDPRLSGTAAEGNLCAINAADDSGTEGGGSVGGGGGLVCRQVREQQMPPHWKAGHRSRRGYDHGGLLRLGPAHLALR